jgi:hypothetical protein
MNNPKKVCAYLDMLGFKYFIFKDLKGAIESLNSYHMMLDLKMQSMMMRRRRNNSNSEELNKIIERGEISSFDHFLPFSDSIFIQSSMPDLFVAQLSSFLISTFGLKSSTYAFSEKGKDPSIVSIRNSSVDSNGSVIQRNALEYWFPVLMRGGISFGECHPININSIIDKHFKTIPNLVGSAVVEAVQLEQAIKGEGPRLICSQAFFNALQDKHDKYIIKYDNIANAHEILWPAFTYIEGNDVHLELINQYENLFRPAANLWKAYGH